MNGNKRLKFLIRARMARTGESYSTARMHVLGKHTAGKLEFARQQANSEEVQQETSAFNESMMALAQVFETTNAMTQPLQLGLMADMEVARRFLAVPLDLTFMTNVQAAIKAATDSVELGLVAD